MNAADSALELAAKRLDRAIALLAQRLGERSNNDTAGGLFDQDRARLTAELDQARSRERDLEAAGAEASEALGRAITEIRAALNGAAPQQEP